MVEATRKYVLAEQNSCLIVTVRMGPGQAGLLEYSSAASV